MDNNLELIERFFNGTLNQEEIADFERRRMTNKAFADEVILYGKANAMIHDAARERLKRHLDDLGQKETGMTLVETFMRYRLMNQRWYAMAASILVLTGLSVLGYFLFGTEKPMTSLAGLYDTYYKAPDADLAILRSSEETNLDATWNSAIRKYNDQQYADALKDFNALLADTAFTNRSAASFYMGICYLNQNMPDSAVLHFSKVSKTSSLVQDAGWYLGLSHLKAGNKQQANEIFDSISQSDRHYKRKEAGKISRVIRKME